MTLVTVEDALATHDRARAESALPLVLGDGVLLERSPLVRHVRKAALVAGFRFTNEPRFHAVALPLLSLEPMLAARCIVYVDNVTVLREAARRAPGRFALSDMTRMGLHVNPVTHESVHGVVRTLLGSFDARTSRLKEPQRAILDLLFEESCANAIDCLSAELSEVPELREFAALNFHQFSAHAQARAREAIGTRETLRILIVGFLHGNFLYKTMSGAAIREALAPVVSARSMGKLGDRQVGRLFRAGLRLSERFRLHTLSVTLRYLGYGHDVFSLVDFPFGRELRRGARLRSALEAFVEIMDLGEEAPAMDRLEAATRQVRERTST